MRHTSHHTKIPLSLIFAATVILSLTAGITGCSTRTPAKGPESSVVETTAPTRLVLETQISETPASETPVPEETPSEAMVSEAPSSNATFPVTVTDQLGREVVIEKKPETIISGYYISTSLLIALGEADRLAGVEAQADKRPVYGMAAPNLLTLPGVGTVKELDLELCASLQPDLVIVPAKLKEKIPAMEELGLTVLAVNPEDQEHMEEMIRLLGTATCTSQTADRLIAAMVKSRPCAGILSLHDPMLALEFCDQLVLIKNGRCLGSIFPAQDSIATMEQALSQIYGPVTLAEWTGKKGEKKLVLFPAAFFPV